MIARLHVLHYGRGGRVVATARQSQSMLTVVLENVVTHGERLLIGRGRADLVEGFHLAFQRSMRDEFAAAVERVVGRPVRAVASEVDIERGVAVKTFFLGEGAPPSAAARRFERGASA